MNALIGIIILVAAIGGGYYYFMQPAPVPEGAAMEEKMEDSHTMMEGVSEPETGTYTVIASQSIVGWAATKPLVPGYVHRGTIEVSEGTIAIDVENETASGLFTLDMAALVVTSLGGGKAGAESRLEGHLKNSDFFDVETYPTAEFEITSVTRTETEGMYTVTGNLTMKDVTEVVTVPAEIYEKDGMLFAHADFAIDRTRWGITFGSSSVFDGLAENAIGDEVTLTLDLVASKQ